MQAISVQPLSRMLKALGDDARLRMVALLAHGELCVCHLEDAVGLSQWATSRHLAALRAAGIVECDRRGTWVYYRLADQRDPDRKQVLKSVVSRLDVEAPVKTRGRRRCK